MTSDVGYRFVTASEIAQYITATFVEVYPVAAWGETSFFYNPGQQRPRGVYFATLKDKDGHHDRASNLGRPAVYRLNFGLSQARYVALFGAKPTRPGAGEVIATGHDFTVLNELMPHPVYGWMGWVCILNPSAETFETIKPLLLEAYTRAVNKVAKKKPSS